MHLFSDTVVCAFSEAAFGEINMMLQDLCNLQSVYATVAALWDVVLYCVCFQTSWSLHNISSWIHAGTSLVPRPRPDFISQPWRKIGSEIKSGWDLGTRLCWHLSSACALSLVLMSWWWFIYLHFLFLSIKLKYTSWFMYDDWWCTYISYIHAYIYAHIQMWTDYTSW